jgi:hypothetical protein
LVHAEQLQGYRGLGEDADGFERRTSIGSVSPWRVRMSAIRSMVAFDHCPRRRRVAAAMRR